MAELYKSEEFDMENNNQDEQSEGYIETQEISPEPKKPSTNKTLLWKKIWEFKKRLYYKVIRLLTPFWNFLQKYVFSRVLWVTDKIVDFVRSQNKTKPLRRKLVVWSISIIVGLVIIIVLIFGVGLYKFGWEDRSTTKLIKIIPYPAAISSSSWITVNQFRKEYGYLEQYAKVTGSTITDKKTTKDQVLEQLIKRQVLKREAPKYGIKVTKNDIDDEYKKLIAAANSETDLLSTIKKLYGMNKADFKELLADQILITKSMDQLPLRVKVQHILLSDENKAKTVLKEVEKDSSKFGSLAKKYSQDTSTKDKNGDLGWVYRGDVVVCNAKSTEFEDAVMKLGNGDISGPIKTKCGFHIVKINGKEGWIDNTYNKWLDDLRTKTKVWKFVE